MKLSRPNFFSAILTAAFLYFIAAPSTLWAASADLKIPDQLNATVKAFEASGGSGVWYSSTFPNRLGGSTSAFYLIRRLPLQVDRDSDFLLLRDPHSKNFLAEMLNAGIPVSLAEIPLESQVGAAAIGRTQLSSDTIGAFGATAATTVVILQGDVSLFTLAHERQHWLDYENPVFMKQLNTDLLSLYDEQKIEPAKLQIVSQLIIEIRGHIAQAKMARDAAAAGWDYVDRAGNVIASSVAKQKEYFSFEESQAMFIFEQAYADSISTVFASLSCAQASALNSTLSEYDSSADSANPLTFPKLTKAYQPKNCESSQAK